MHFDSEYLGFDSISFTEKWQLDHYILGNIWKYFFEKSYKTKKKVSKRLTQGLLNNLPAQITPG